MESGRISTDLDRLFPNFFQTMHAPHPGLRLCWQMNRVVLPISHEGSYFLADVQRTSRNPEQHSIEDTLDESNGRLETHSSQTLTRS